MLLPVSMDLLCVLMIRVPGYRPEVAGSILGGTRFPE
jgi:hypothetical protein